MGLGENGQTDEQLPAGALQAKSGKRILTFWFEQTAPRKLVCQDQALIASAMPTPSRFGPSARGTLIRLIWESFRSNGLGVPEPEKPGLRSGFAGRGWGRVVEELRRSAEGFWARKGLDPQRFKATHHQDRIFSETGIEEYTKNTV